MDRKVKPCRRFEAKVNKLANEADAKKEKENTPHAPHHDRVVARIQKCLELAKHSNTSEGEAQAALRMATKLMDDHNVRQADIVAEQVNAGDASALAGSSDVSITTTNSKGQIGIAISQTWVHKLASAMTIFFDCQCYHSSRSSSIRWRFYGIAANTVAAAVAFEWVHNLVQEWAAVVKGVKEKNSYQLGFAKGLIKTAQQEKADEERRVRERAAAEVAAKEREEQEARQKEIARLSANPVVKSEEEQLDIKIKDETEVKVKIKIEADDIKNEWSSTPDRNPKVEDDSPIVIKDESDYPITIKDEPESPITITDESDIDIISIDSNTDDEDSSDSLGLQATPFDDDDDDDSPVDLTNDFDDELRRFMPQPGPSILQNETSMTDPVSEARERPPPPEGDEALAQKMQDEESGLLWRDAGALILFRQHAQTAAKDYLKKESIKLRKGRKRNYNAKDPEAYQRGQKDSRKIDVKRRRVENGI